MHCTLRISNSRCWIWVFREAVSFCYWLRKQNGEVSGGHTLYYRVLSWYSSTCWYSKILVGPSCRVGRITFLLGNFGA